MSEWRGFLVESKSFMNYPEYKLNFWVYFPRAWIRFHFYILQDWYWKKRCPNHYYRKGNRGKNS